MSTEWHEMSRLKSWPISIWQLPLIRVPYTDSIYSYYGSNCIVPIGATAHSASYPMGDKGLYPGVKAAYTEVNKFEAMSPQTDKSSWSSG